MISMGILNKPEYWCRPTQILSKLHFIFRGYRHDEPVRIHLPWGDVIEAKAKDAIGKSLLTFGVYELAVSEVLWRLVDHGDVCVDIGANIGYMTSLLAKRVGGSGRVVAFEPHPAIFSKLMKNVDDFSGKPQITLVERAVGAAAGETMLIEPTGFAENKGTAFVVPLSNDTGWSGSRHQIKLQQLDSVFSDGEKIGLIKIDVEGAEEFVFQGAERLLTNTSVRDIVWEDHNQFPSKSVQYLKRCGYAVYQFTKTILGVSIWDPSASRAVKRHARWEATNFLATSNPARALARLKARGWHCLRPH